MDIKKSCLNTNILFQRVYVKGKVFILPLLVDIAKLKQRIASSIDGLNSDTLTCVWAEIDYCLHVCRMIKGVTGLSTFFPLIILLGNIGS
ncbi:hypothetical protein TNCV_1027751 [Trichonephila clavipes]|nr:hypothetical protein TNCV_1027751 [Trichonephila clavipes]